MNKEMEYDIVMAQSEIERAIERYKRLTDKRKAK